MGTNRHKTMPPSLIGFGLLLMSAYQLWQHDIKEAGFLGGIGVSLLAFLVAVNPPKQADWLGRIAVWIGIAGAVIALGVTFLL